MTRFDVFRRLNALTDQETEESVEGVLIKLPRSRSMPAGLLVKLEHIQAASLLEEGVGLIAYG